MTSIDKVVLYVSHGVGGRQNETCRTGLPGGDFAVLVDVGCVDTGQDGAKFLVWDPAVSSWGDSGGDGVLSSTVTTGDGSRSQTYFFLSGGLTGVVWFEDTGVGF